MRLCPKLVRLTDIAKFLPLLFSACVHQHPVPKSVAMLDAATLASRVRLAKSSASEMTADAQLTYFGSRGRMRLQATLLAARPDRFRANVLGPQGGALYAVGCDGGELVVLDLLQHRGLRTPAQSASLGALFHRPALGMTPEGLVSLLFGEAPLLPESVCEKTWEATRNQVGLLCRDRIEGSGSPPSTASYTRLYVNPETWQVVEAVFFHEMHGTLTFHVRERGTGRIATRTEVIWRPLSGEEERVELELRDLDVAPHLNADAFTLAVPEGMAMDESLDPKMAPAPAP